jgi:UDP-glucose 4-epimerase
VADILITGAHGFIGRHLAQCLSLAGHRVGGVGHGVWPQSEASRWGMSTWVNGEVLPGNLDLVKRDIGTPDMVFHLAGGSSVGVAILNPRDDFFRTVASTAELLEWMRHEAPLAALVAVSSAAVYGAGHEGPIAETAKLNPYSPYGYHKHMMEELCRSYALGYGMRVAVARLFSVYGPGLRKQLLWDLCAQLATGATEISLGGSGQELRDWTHVADVSRALAEIARLAAPDLPILNVGTGTATSVTSIAHEVIAQWCTPGQREAELRFSGKSRPGDPFSLVALALAMSRPGFTWRHELKQDLADYVRWYRGRREVD